MPGSIGVITGTGNAKSGVTVRGRIVGNQGQPATTADFSTITYNVRDLTAGTNVGNGTLTPASVMFDALQQSDPTWTVDGRWKPGPDGRYGYNFRALIPASLFTAFAVDAVTAEVTPHLFQIDVTFTPAAGQPIVQPWRFTPNPTWP